MELKDYIKKYGKKYSEMLGIDVKKEPFKWFLASMLFGAPIREETAIRTYRIFEREHLTQPESIVNAGMDKVVEVLDEGGYTRYDIKTAKKIIEACTNILKRGGFESILEGLKSPDELKLASGIGKATINIFLREMGIEHEPGEYAILAASQHGILKDGRIVIEGVDEIEAEIAMMKLGRLCKKRKCDVCPAPCNKPRIYNYYL